MTDSHRGGSPPGGGTAPSAFGAKWFYVTCPLCLQRIRQPFARVPSAVINAHRHRGRHDVCRLLVVVTRDLQESAVPVISEGDVDVAMQVALEQGLQQLSKNNEEDQP